MCIRDRYLTPHIDQPATLVRTTTTNWDLQGRAGARPDNRVGTPSLSLRWLVKVRSGPKLQPEGAA
eukprot:9705358-Alexandrium_andersonii.AAC.1